MTTVTLRDAKATFSSLVDEAMSGEFVTITRHGKPVAAIVSLEAAEEAKKALNKSRSDFGDYLMSFPGGLDLERNESPMRDIDL
ncbi:type II toxin-antitoxin system Phd/YefM family antitoxin [Rhizobium sp. S152]|uniref:type II toxin-antitoxin system Phd/YefM family antitoxin n=1 Tax=Rhizobium sp. S152 TaxID=3055038 RepID=UPI0025AA2239|nr:type II toxin-antitoxin system Phd/YefM family antitoxin [Rhizobium sp. S152]MDM9625940.1 type II toxin-antitoxin system Phd/YefM family antitoxin [Rhizobium sp. S152]